MLQTVASIKGLGACLLQEEKSVHLLVKLLQKPRKDMFAIEIKLLAVAWAIEKFHHFLYASHFILETDQKLLEAVLSKSLNQTTHKITVDTNQDFCLPLYNNIHSCSVTNQIADCLLQLGCQKDTY